MAVIRQIAFGDGTVVRITDWGSSCDLTLRSCPLEQRCSMTKSGELLESYGSYNSYANQQLSRTKCFGSAESSETRVVTNTTNNRLHERPKTALKEAA